MNYTFNRRYKKEIEFLSNHFNNIKIKENKFEDKVKINLTLEKYNIIIILNSEYPFCPPEKIKINDLDINCYIELEVTLLLKKYFNIFCIKCESNICENKWMPTFNLIKILEEQIRYFDYINSIKNIIEIQKKIYINSDLLLKIINYIKE